MADSVTKRIYDKSDKELRQKLLETFIWVNNEVGSDYHKLPAELLAPVQCCDIPELRELKEIPWIGHAEKLYIEVAFAHLRDKFRKRAITEFIDKVTRICTP